MLRVEGLVAAPGHPRVSFEARDGRCIGLWCREPEQIAALADTLGGLRAPVEGRVLLDELESVRDARRMQLQIAHMLPQAVARQLTLIEYAGAVAILRPRRPSAVSAASLIERLQLDPHRALSTPAAQAEAALVAALLPDARLVLLTDPFALVTDATRLAAIDYLRALASSTTIVVIAALAERDVRAVSHKVITVGAAR